MRILFKFADSEEVVGALNFEREDDLVGTEPRRFVFTSYSGSHEVTMLDRDSDIVCRVYGLSTVEWRDSSAAVGDVNHDQKEAEKATAAAVKANEKNPGGVPPVPVLVPAKGGTRSAVDSGDEE